MEEEKAEHRERERQSIGFQKSFITFFFFFLNCADVENCGSFKSFGFICIYRLYSKSIINRPCYNIWEMLRNAL